VITKAKRVNIKVNISKFPLENNINYQKKTEVKDVLLESDAMTEKCRCTNTYLATKDSCGRSNCQRDER
jgi:hypothetical protein